MPNSLFFNETFFGDYFNRIHAGLYEILEKIYLSICLVHLKSVRVRAIERLLLTLVGWRNPVRRYFRYVPIAFWCAQCGQRLHNSRWFNDDYNGKVILGPIQGPLA